MLRKTLLALIASAALSVAALAPTSASAHLGGGWGGGYGGWGYHPFVRVYAGPVYGYGYGGCTVRRWVYTPYGAVLRWVNVC